MRDAAKLITPVPKKTDGMDEHTVAYRKMSSGEGIRESFKEAFKRKPYYLQKRNEVKDDK